MTRSLILAALLAIAVPVAAQMPPPPPGQGPGGPGWHGGALFAGLSDAGRATMRAALRGADPRQDRAATDAARDRMLAILDADRLDPQALRRAMDDEREAANAAKSRHQAALLAGFQQLSPADRHAFVANARAMRSRIEERLAGWKGRRGRGGPGGEMPPPPPPQ